MNNRITKLMGESFKLHAQALVGYEDSLRISKDQPIHPMPAKTLASVGTAYWSRQSPLSFLVYRDWFPYIHLFWDFWCFDLILDFQRLRVSPSFAEGAISCLNYFRLCVLLLSCWLSLQELTGVRCGHFLVFLGRFPQSNNSTPGWSCGLPLLP